MTDGSLIADPVHTPAGLPFVDEFKGVQADVDSGSVIDPMISGATAALDLLSMAADPLAAIAAAGVAWLLENVGPLREALDELTGDPDEIAAYATTWTNVATELSSASTDLDNEVATGTVSKWKGEAADAYRGLVADHSSALLAMSSAAEAMASITTTMGTVCAGVREIIVDIISECVGSLLAKLPRWIAETVGTLGIGLLAVIGEAAALIAKFVAKIKGFFDALARTVG